MYREKRQRQRWGGERARRREGPGVVYISCLLTWLCGQAANRTQGKEQVVLFLCLLLWLRFSKRLPPLLSSPLALSIHLSSLPFPLPLFRPEQSREQRFPLLTPPSTTRACHYLSLKLQTSSFLLLRFFFCFLIVLCFKSNLKEATCGPWRLITRQEREKEEVAGRRDTTWGCFKGTLLVVGGGEVRKMLDGGDRVRCTVCADWSFS